MNNLYAKNPRTGRMIKKATSRYRHMIKTGEIIETETAEPAETPKTVETIEKIKTADPAENIKKPAENISVKEKIIPVMVNLVSDHKDDFQDLSEKETTKLLRRLLLARLAPSEKEKKTKEKKKQKKKKKKLIKVETESDSDSDSDSD
jgi:hypothetical protein